VVLSGKHKYDHNNYNIGVQFVSRPKPTILREFVDNKTYRAEQVLAADAIYAVFYDGKPINLRSVNTLIDYPGPKYRRASHGQPGHAFNLAEKLNILFKTDKFAVYKLTEGVPVAENDDE